MTTGRLIAVVGPSGVGKDSVMAALCCARPGLHRVRRVITRSSELGGEDFDAVTEAQFESLVRDGAFCLHWTAHGLSYAIRADVPDRLAEGQDCIVNLSRRMLAAAEALSPFVVVLALSAPPAVLADRLAGRGRETADDIAARLTRVAPLAPGGNVVRLVNDGPLSVTVKAALAALYPERV